MEPQKSQAILDHDLLQIRELLQKHHVVEHLTRVQDSRKHELIESLVHRQNLAELRNRLARLHPADVAYFLDNLPVDERIVVWEQVRGPRGGEVLLEASDSVRRQLIADTPDEPLFALLRELDADDLTYLADDLPTAVLDRCLQSLSTDERSWLVSSMNFAPDTVGALMSNVMVTVRDTDTLEQVLAQVRALDEFPAHTDKLFVLDRRGQFRGVLPLTLLLRGRPASPVADVMASDAVAFRADDNARDASLAFERYDLVSAPVVNERGKLAGRLTVDVMMDYLREKNSDELLKLAGLSREEDLFTSIWGSARNRWLWLSLNLVTAFIASRVIGVFEDSILHLVALAALMPIVASVGGNTGNQTTALVIRAVAMGQATAANVVRLVRRELGIGLLNGVLLGVVVALFALAFYRSTALAAVIAAAMLINLLIAAGVGLAVPLTLHRLGRDPALGSSVLLTATTDSMGFLIFLGLATVFLVK
jgi:magnesium transporter